MLFLVYTFSIKSWTGTNNPRGGFCGRLGRADLQPTIYTTATCEALTSLKGGRRYQITQGYFHDREDNYEYRKQLPLALQTDKKASLRILIGEDPTQADSHLRIGLQGANEDYTGVAMKVSLNGRSLHEGSTENQLVVTTGTRHGNGSHAPPTEAYIQWPISDAATLHQGWNDIEIVLTASPKALQLVETEIAINDEP